MSTHLTHAELVDLLGKPESEVDLDSPRVDHLRHCLGCAHAFVVALVASKSGELTLEGSDAA